MTGCIGVDSSLVLTKVSPRFDYEFEQPSDKDARLSIHMPVSALWCYVLTADAKPCAQLAG